MQRITSVLKVNSHEFRNNELHNRRLADELKERQRAARFQRPERELERLRRQNKLFVRDRVEALLDPHTPFLEFSTLAANKAYEGEVPGAAQVVGIGIVAGREVIVHADDASVKGGAWYPLSVKKIVRALDIAIENRLPVVHLCDCAGGFLPLQAEFFADRYHAGRILRNQSILSKMGVPQVAIAMGHCTAGGAYVPALSDYNIIVEGTGAIFLGGPPVVKAATGENVSVEELGGAHMHTGVSGTSDYLASSEMHAIAIARDIVAHLKRPAKASIDRTAPEPPLYDPCELYGIIPKDPRVQFDMREIVARLVDGSRFHEYQPRFGTSLVCGFARLHGYQIGVIANNGVLFNESALKGAHFIQLCDRNRTPLLFLQNVTGFMVGREYERRGITKDGAKLIMAMSGASVPKLTVICNGSHGAGTYAMAGRAFDPRFVFTWPQAQISAMGAEQAAGVLTHVKARQLAREGGRLSEQELETIREPILEEYRERSSAYYATSEIWDDGILDPIDTRSALAVALSASLSAPIEAPHYGVFRM
ncbi:methylcrotonoyl-CoA carboxylase [Bradyrhizobium sp. ISRA443]|uniref:acyl-CoA carboxylase subunit beta n=1 Tax=unclassified Bradyrhizobium TaxID=2631580 RepID=UPI00247A4F58|nr:MULTISPECIES: carboxyl transferase domain-containing protein [unclassified Bradyrhizobium]WGR97801.1 methylcrotonoyl-CoA carboxylase [Bradyrhizobium sp. ISRA436]WGS04690.1 methylcrotonoyl-CoA carboxylase [Bradyrhizobium sp. ISRA437]WGS11571.1 methylcrotonoyl-CoA carboxylase [Bradyrhizobium sp. ISRA443]